MPQPQVRIVSTPQGEEQKQGQNQTRTQDGHRDDARDFLQELAEHGSSTQDLEKRRRQALAEINDLRSDNRWEDVVTLFYPLEQHAPELVQAGLDTEVRAELAFALGQTGRHDQAISEFEACVQTDPESFLAVSGLAYAMYNALFAAKNREILLTPDAKRKRVEAAHTWFEKAQQLRPDGVTNFYRQGMLYKNLQGKTKLAVPLFAKAVENWRAYPSEKQQSRHQERKNYIKSLYNLASCRSKNEEVKGALPLIEECIKEDEASGLLKMEHKYFALGKIHYQLGNLDQALHALEMAAQFTNAKDGDYVFELKARVFLQKKEFQTGLDTVRTIPGKARRPYVHWTEADLLLGLGQVDKAKEVLHRSAERDRRSQHRALVRLAKIEFWLKNHAQAKDLALRADTFHRETFTTPDADGLFWAAAACIRLGQMEEASRLTDELEACRPGYPYLSKLRRLCKV
jgi:tetratricopeptide (TPR) repeat protein